jgi:RNA polymerase sigma-70 factor, ECF subfamily
MLSPAPQPSDNFRRRACPARPIGVPAPYLLRALVALEDIAVCPAVVRERKHSSMMPSGTEYLESLLRRVAGGDLAAFRDLYDAAAGKLLAIAFNILRDHQIAEDVVQEAFLRVWRNAGRYDPARGAPLAWMGVIARNAALDMAVAPSGRRAGCRHDRYRHCGGGAAGCASRPVPETPAGRSGQGDGLSHSELAEHLSVPLGTAKSWIRRGTMSLKECMES